MEEEFQKDQAPKNEEKNDFQEGYQEAAEKSFWRIWKNRWLWLWGVVLPGGVSLTFNYDYKQKDLLAQKSKIEPDLQKALEFWEQYQEQLMAVAIALVIGLVFLWVASFVLRAGIIKVLDQLQTSEQEKKFTFIELWQKGRDKAGELLKLDVLVLVFVVGIMLILGLPVFSLFMSQREESAALLYLLALLIFVPVAALSYFIRYMGMVHVVSANLDVWDSIERSYNLTLKNLRESAKFFLLIFLLDAGKTLVMMAAFVVDVLVAIILAAILALMGLDEALLLVFSGAVFSVILVILLIFIRSFFSLWSLDLWIWWTKKNGGIKVEDPATKKEEAKVLAKSPEPVIGVENCHVARERHGEPGR